jgi:hypothetical protein
MKRKNLRLAGRPGVIKGVEGLWEVLANGFLAAHFSA